MDRTFVAIDVETTGLEAGTDEVIEIAAVKFAGDHVLETFQTLVKPRHSLPLKIARLTGISEEMLADAPRFSEAAPRLVSFVKSYPLVGHSIGFDLRMLGAQGMRFAQPAYDTFELATLLMPRAPAYRLGALAEALGVPLDEAHRALADADATRQVFMHMLRRIEALDLQDISEITRLTAKLDWPLRELFAEVERAKARTVFLDQGRTTKDEATTDDRLEMMDDGRWTIDQRPGPKSQVPSHKSLGGEPIPLKPTGDTRPLDLDEIRRFFSPEGPMGQAFEGYEHRPEQATMAEAVTEAFNNGETLMIEAGTGVGKCISGDAWITFESGSRMQIGEICRAVALPTEPILCINASGKLVYQRIQGVHCNGVRLVWRLRTALGRTITATANHPLLTVAGWQQLRDLRVGDRIATLRSLPAGRETQFRQGAFVVGAMLGDGSCSYSDVLTFTNFDPAWESFGDQRYNPNDDLFPIAAWQIIDQERQRVGKSWYAIRETCVVASDRTREISRPKMRAIGEFLESPKLLEISAADIYWDRIVSIEAVGEAETFDLTMEGEPNFVANDIVVHNSIAYLVPAALFASRRGERVVISTNTINLQDQLFFKDIPALQRIIAEAGVATDDQRPTADDLAAQNSELGTQDSAPPFTAALLKGRGNYLCLRRYKELRRDGRLVSDEIKTLLKVQLWLPTTTSGDKAELLLMDKENAAWGRINVTPETCTGPRCPEFKSCFFFKARRAAEAAHLVVVNHALMLADLAAEAMVLPAYDHVIVDEAHNLEDVATDQFSFTVDQAKLLEFLDGLFAAGGAQASAGLFAELPVHFRESAATQGDMDKASAIAQAAGPAVTRARQSVYDCFNLLTAFMTQAAEVSAYDARLRITDATRRAPAWEAIERAWENLALNLNGIGDALGKLEALLTELKNAELLDYDTLLLRVQAARRYCADARVNIEAIIVGGEEQKITWITYDRARDTLALNAAPLSVAGLLEANLFSQKSAVTLASATLSVNGDFGYVKQRIGLKEPTEVQLDSPFDYQSQALVFIPNDVPEPNQRGYQPAIEETIVNLCAATGGRALVLFTANSALRQTYRAIQEPLEQQGIAVLGQGLDGSRRSLLERFKEFPRTVLLGTTSFWEGVDVVGDALSVLIIAKLPFSVPNDPIFTARSEGFQDAFNEYAVPQAILRFKQGFGRLIRSKEDRGVVAVLDRRLLSKKYGQIFLDSLPHTTVRTGPAKHLPLLAARFLV